MRGMLKVSSQVGGRANSNFETSREQLIELHLMLIIYIKVDGLMASNIVVYLSVMDVHQSLIQRRIKLEVRNTKKF